MQLSGSQRLNSLNSATAVCAIVALIAGYIVFLRSPWSHTLSGPLLMLGLLAMLAETFPVEIPGLGLRISLTLPYLATVATCYSGRDALVTDAVVIAIAGLFVNKSHYGRREASATVMNISVASVSVLCGWLATTVSNHILIHPATVETVLSFMTGYAIANYCCLHLIRFLLPRQRLPHKLATFEMKLLMLVFYVLTGVLTTALVTDGLVYFVPLTLVPMLALRTGLLYEARMVKNYNETITALTMMLQRAHPYTHEHVDRVASAAEQVARRLGLSARRARMVRAAAVLHDIGKIAVDEAVLDKPSSLTTEERNHIQQHASWGANILEPISSFREIVPWIRYHHERLDGKGYPEGLFDEDIPVESKIIAVVDAYDAMTGSGATGALRAYRRTLSESEAILELERCASTQFCPTVVEAFKETLRSGR